MILLDTGPIVGFVHRDDQHHERAVALFKSLQPPIGTVWPVISEALHLVDFAPAAQEAVWTLLEESVELLPLDPTDIPRMRELMRKYGDLPMDLADAALVRVAERERIRRVATFDHRDFRLYRPKRLGRFQILG